MKKEKYGFWCSIFGVGVFVFAGFVLTKIYTLEASAADKKILSLSEQALQKIGSDAKISVSRKTGNITFLSNEQKDLPLSMSLNGVSDPVKVANQFVKEYGKFFGINNPTQNLQYTKTQEDTLGMKHVRYSQIVKGIPVFGSELIVHVGKDGNITAANGNVLPDADINTSPNFSKGEAIKKAQAYWREQFKIEDGQVVNTDLEIYNNILNQYSNESQSHLVYVVELYEKKSLHHEYYFIDAHTGVLVKQITGVQDAINRVIYDCSYGNGTCYADTLLDGYTYGRSEGNSARGTNPTYLTNDVDDLYDVSSIIHSYFSDTFGLNGANNEGGIGDGVYAEAADTTGFTYLDTVTDDVCPNAYFDGYSINFCNKLVVTDIAGHEYGHAVAQFSGTGGFVYEYESGALSEAYADIFGEAVEYYDEGASPDEWLIGEDTDVEGLASPLRSMRDPSSLGAYPEDFYDSAYYCGYGDGGGVHYNNTIVTFAAYHIAEGGSLNGCTINGIGRAKEEQIFYRALEYYLTSTSGMNEAYDAILYACNDLYDNTDCVEVEKALKAAKMDQGGACSSEPEQGSGCGDVEEENTLSTITRVGSDTPNGVYTTGDLIDIDITFSENVSSDLVLVWVETGSNDVGCSFSISDSTHGTCEYVVTSGDTSSDLNVKEIEGDIRDADGAAMENFSIAKNLATVKNIRIDTTDPTVTASVDSGIIGINTEVELSMSEPGTIYYTTNGRSTTEYEDPIRISEDTQLMFNGVDTVGNQSSNIVRHYYIARKGSIITGAGPGGGPHVRAFDYHGTAEDPSNLFAFHPDFKGGVHVAACDTDGDGTDEIITGAGPGDKPIVKIFEKSGEYDTEFYAYADTISGGVYVACGDINNDGYSEIITGVPEGFGPHIRTFNQWGDMMITPGFFAYGENVRTGIRVAAGDLDGDGDDEIIAGTGNGAGTHVRTFDKYGNMIFTPGFFIYGEDDRGGIKVAAGDVDGNGKDEIITGSGVGRAPEVRVYDRFGNLESSFTPYASTFTLGIKVAAGDVDQDGVDEIITGTEAGGGPQVRVFEQDGTVLDDFFAYGETFRGGVDVAAGYFIE